MKTKLKILGLGLALFSLPAMAQTSNKATEGSGSGNGSENRDLLSYQQKLKDSALSTQSLDEALEKLKNDFKTLSQIEIPTYQGPGDDFWKKISQKDRNTLINFDRMLSIAVENSIQSVSDIQPALSSELATINETIRETPEYEKMGFKKEFKSSIKKQQKELTEKIIELLKKSINDLLLGLSTRTNAYINFSTGESYGAVENPFVLKYIEECETGACIELINQRTNQYIQFIQKSLETGVAILGVSLSLKTWVEIDSNPKPPFLSGLGHESNACQTTMRLKEMFAIIQKSRFKNTLLKNQQAIRQENSHP